MYSIISPFGEAFQDHGVWYQDYNVKDESTGEVTIKRYTHNGSNWVEAISNKVDINKRVGNNTSAINLKKNVVNLDKTLINLSKSSGIAMNNHTAKVAVVVDYSYSMDHLFESGAVQRALSRLVPIGLRFDDNGELDVWLFHSKHFRMDGMTLDNYDNYVNNVIKRSGINYGGTQYASVIEDLIQKYEVEEHSEVPAYVIFITDGDNSDKARTDEAIRKSSNYGIFIQFVGIGNAGFNYLRKLDDLSGRYCDNTGFIQVKDFDSMTDDDLYKSLLEQYTLWLKTMNLR